MRTLKLSLDPSPERDGRPKGIRNVRIASAIVFLGALIASAGIGGIETDDTVAAVIASSALFIYGVMTCFDETATFPRWLYAGLALLGAGLTVFHAAALFS